jgi:hydroxyacylglutathione hydrolase/adenylyltransferase/sulfurtransferase
VAVNDEAATETHLDVTRAAELIEAGALLIDVRQPHEWEGGRLAGARHIEVNELTAAAGSIDRERPVLFYCRSGARSGMAAEAFRQAGFDAFNLAGGIESWVAEGRQIEPADGEIRAPLPPS